jgi:hypothetical protein
MYQFMKNLEAPKEWFKANVNAIVKEYAPHHPIQKEDIIVGEHPCPAIHG